MIKLSLILFISGILLITAGYANNMKSDCDPKVEIKYVSRNVYDEILKNKIINFNENKNKNKNKNENENSKLYHSQRPYTIADRNRW